ncbi:MAG: dTDP-4-dehydrorhamnose 3,5-epimerase family protein [bacterium]
MKSNIEGAIIKELTLHEDSRGWLIEIFRQDELEPSLFPVMSYISMTKPGELRGPHEHKHQTDLFCFYGTSDFKLYLWDNRSDSKTYQKSEIIKILKDKPCSILIPPGIIHGYRNIGNSEGLVFNAPNRLHAGKGKRGEIDVVRYEDDPACPFRMED